MKRVPVFFLLVALVSCVSWVYAQHEGGAKTEHAGEHAAEGEGAHLELWKWANFAILAGALGYMIGKNAGPFFHARSREIRKGLVEAGEMRAEAEASMAAVEANLAHLGKELEKLRQEAGQEQEAELQRMRQEAAAELAKVQADAAREIDAAGKAARLDLKRHSAELAVSLAEQKIRARITPATQNALVDGFTKELGRRAAPAASA
jgi:F-type H+-transporting ATPase subunit b